MDLTPSEITALEKDEAEARKAARRQARER